MTLREKLHNLRNFSGYTKFEADSSKHKYFTIEYSKG